MLRDGGVKGGLLSRLKLVAGEVVGLGVWTMKFVRLRSCWVRASLLPPCGVSGRGTGFGSEPTSERE